MHEMCSKMTLSSSKYIILEGEENNLNGYQQITQHKR